MYHRNDGKDENSIIQNRFTAYLVSAITRRKADYLRVNQRKKTAEIPTDPDTLVLPENSDATSPEIVLSTLENAALLKVLSGISERDRFIFFAHALYRYSFDEIALKFGLGYQGVAAAYYRTCKKIRNATGGIEK